MGVSSLLCLLIFCSKVLSQPHSLLLLSFLYPPWFSVSCWLLFFLFHFVIPTALLFICFTVSFHCILSLSLSSLLTHFCVHISSGELTDDHSLMSQDLLLYPDSHVINKIGLFLLYAPLKPYHHAFRFLPHNFSDMHFFFARHRQVWCAFQMTTSRRELITSHCFITVFLFHAYYVLWPWDLIGCAYRGILKVIFRESDSSLENLPWWYECSLTFKVNFIHFPQGLEKS